MIPKLCFELARRELSRIYLFVFGCHLEGETCIRQKHIAEQLCMDELEIANSVRILEREGLVFRSKDEWNGVSIEEDPFGHWAEKFEQIAKLD